MSDATCAKAFYFEGSFSEALSAYSELLVSTEEAEAQAHIHRNIGKCHEGAGEIAAAITAYDEALPLWTDTAHKARTLFRLCVCHIARGEIDQGKARYQEAEATKSYRVAISALTLSQQLAFLRHTISTFEREAETITEIQREAQVRYDAAFTAWAEDPTVVHALATMENISPERAKELLHVLAETAPPPFTKTITPLIADLDRAYRDVTASLKKEREGINSLSTEALFAFSRELTDRASALYALGKFDEALKTNTLALALHKETCRENHPRIVRALTAIAQCLIALGRFEEATEKLQEALGKYAAFILANEEGDQSAVAQVHYELAIAFYAAGRYEEAQRLHSRVLEHAPEAMRPLLADAFTGIGNCLCAQEQYEEAIKNHSAAHTLYIELYGKTSRYVATVWHNLASCYAWQGNYKQAAGAYREALEIWETLYGIDHPDSLWAQSCLASLPGAAPLTRAEPPLSPDEIDSRTVITHVKTLLQSTSELVLEKNPSGFIRIQLPPPHELADRVEKIRVHCWPKDQGVLPIVEAAHTHPRHFISLVIRGGYTHRLYTKDDSSGASMRSFRVLKSGNPHRRDIAAMGPIKIRQERKETVQAGQIIDFPIDLIHSVVEAKAGTVTINLVLKTATLGGGYFDIYMEDAPGIGEPKLVRESVLPGRLAERWVTTIIEALDATAS